MNCSLHFSLKCWKNNDQWNAIKLGKRSIFYFFTLFISFSKHRIIFHFDALFLAGLQLLEDQPRWPMAYEIFERVKIEPPLALDQNSWVTSIFLTCSMLVCNVQERNCGATILCGFFWHYTITKFVAQVLTSKRDNYCCFTWSTGLIS